MQRRDSRPQRTPLSTLLCLHLFFLALLQSCSGLRCNCNNEREWECRTYGSCNAEGPDSACVTIVYRTDDGSEERADMCLLRQHNPGACEGERNNDNLVYACCTTDMCNVDLNPTLPSRTNTSANTTQSSTEEPRPTPSVILPDSSISIVDVNPSPTPHVVTPPPPPPTSSPPPSPPSTAPPPTTTTEQPTSDLLLCSCSDSQFCHGSTSCHSDYKCYREEIYNTNGKKIETRLGCLNRSVVVNLEALDVCGGLFNVPTKSFGCCNEKSFCNEDLVLDSQMTSEPDVESAPNTSSEDGQMDLYYLLTVVVVTVTIAIILVVVFVLMTVWLRYKKERSKVAALAVTQKKEQMSLKFTNLTSKKYSDQSGALHVV